jgi:polysaccharide export outer membrane protein
MTPFSAVNSIVILRRHADGQQEAFPFRYGDVEDGDDLDQNIVLQPGDVIVVP